MKHPLIVRGLTLGDGRPKICVPLTGKSDADLESQLLTLLHADYDLVEWRLDYLPANADYATLHARIRHFLPTTPLLATFRSFHEGGMRALRDPDYIALYRQLLVLGVDLIDVEWRRGRQVMEALLKEAHHHHTPVIASYHDFQSTPTHEQILRILLSMQDWGADMLKIAVMPQTAEDVLTLLSASEEMIRIYAARPLITMSMGTLGLISRLCGNITGSAITFGCVSASSAPGQIPANDLRHIVSLLTTQQRG